VVAPYADKVVVVEVPSCRSAWRSSRCRDVYASESTNRMAVRNCEKSSQRAKLTDAPAKKLLFPDPLRPTTTLCRGENGSMDVWSRSTLEINA